MIRIVFICLFILCVSISVYGILLVNKLRSESEYKTIFGSLFYQQILMTVFGFYGIWGHLLTKIIFQNDIQNNLLIDRISTNISLMAIPFVIASWYFFIDFVLHLLNFRKVKLFATIFLLLSSSISLIIVQYGFLNSSNIEFSIQWFLIETILLSLLLIIGILKISIVQLPFKNKIGFISGLILLLLLMSGTIVFFEFHLLIKVSFIFFYFLTNAFLSVSFNYLIPFPKLKLETPDKNYQSFCENFGISNRESEIIQLICEGHTNKIIAEKLFITIQTVKDHSSRIYLKTEVKNRTQLAHLVSEFTHEQA